MSVIKMFVSFVFCRVCPFILPLSQDIKICSPEGKYHKLHSTKSRCLPYWCHCVSSLFFSWKCIHRKLICQNSYFGQALFLYKLFTFTFTFSMPFIILLCLNWINCTFVYFALLSCLIVFFFKCICRFKTVRGYNICSNPQLPWVKRAIQYLDEKAAAKTTSRPIFSTSTFKTTSMLNTTSHWNTTG